MKKTLRTAVFIDKDGTLVENVPYNADPARQRFMPGGREALAALANAGHQLVVVTNQSGLARGDTVCRLTPLRWPYARCAEWDEAVHVMLGDRRAPDVDCVPRAAGRPA